MEGDGQVRAGGGELEGTAASDVAPQDPGGDLVAVSDGQHVAVADVQPVDRRASLKEWSGWLNWQKTDFWSSQVFFHPESSMEQKIWSSSPPSRKPRVRGLTGW